MSNNNTRYYPYFSRLEAEPQPSAYLSLIRQKKNKCKYCTFLY